jgi:tetratricopeptide (TPR) repeat protein
VIAHQVGDHEAAVKLIGTAIQANPSATAYHCNLGNALYELGRPEDAVASYRLALILALVVIFPISVTMATFNEGRML